MLGQKLQPLMSNSCLSSEIRTKLCHKPGRGLIFVSLATTPICYHSGFDSWVVAIETQGSHFKTTLRLVTSPTNLERDISY